jgi:hypothetical protein
MVRVLFPYEVHHAKLNLLPLSFLAINLIMDVTVERCLESVELILFNSHRIHMPTHR